MQPAICSLRTRLATAALALLAAASAWADPPARAIRLALTSGPVSFLPAGEDHWVQARVNRPLWIGDRLWSDRGARAELQIGGATLFFAPETSVSILNFDDRRAQFEVAQGTLDIYVRAIDSGDTIEIDTPNLAFVVHRPGQYRIDVRPNGESTAVFVERGEGETFGGNAAYVLRTGQSFRFYGVDLADYSAEPFRRDPFSAWVAERVRAYERSESARYVAAETIGYADLDAHGTWRTVANYGPVWVPTRVDTGWAPYRYGHWSWVDPWGWTWIDDAPWGFAPFHYGRWAYIDNRYWGWVPGPRNARPVYAPALVAFVGGDNFRISVSSGLTAGVAWFPLAPGEVYRPAYTASRDYFTRVNVSNTVVNVTNVTNVYNNPARVTDVRYVNFNNVNGVTAVPTQAFAQAQPVQRAAARIDREALQRTPVIAAAPISPARASVAGAAPPAQARPAPEVVSRQVVAKTPPPPAPPSMDRRQELMKQQPGRPLDRDDLAKIATPAQANANANVRVVETSPAARPIQPAAERPGEPGKGRERGRDAQIAQPAPQSAPAKAPEPAHPAQAAPSPEPQPRAQPPHAQSARERRETTPPPPRAPEPAAKAPEPARPTQAAPSPEPQPRAQPPQAQSARERRETTPPPPRAPEPAAKAPEPARPTQAAPSPEPQPRAQPAPAQNGRERRDAAPPPQAATPPVAAPPPNVAPPPQAPQPQRRPEQAQPQREARPAMPPPETARGQTPVPAPAPQADTGRRGNRDAAKEPQDKDEQRDKSDKPDKARKD